MAIAGKKKQTDKTSCTAAEKGTSSWAAPKHTAANAKVAVIIINFVDEDDRKKPTAYTLQVLPSTTELAVPIVSKDSP